MRTQLPKLPALLIILLLLLMTSETFAGVSGKISGTVLDVKTSEPVVGATVRVMGTNLVTQTDVDGEYFVINVPSGKYDVAVTYVGYEPTVKKGVRVLMDLTSPVDFDLVYTAVELGDEVVVYASNPVIKKDLTASKIIFTSDHLKTLPNIITVQSVLTNYPGVVVDRNNSLHVRGGRSGQVSYYFDGYSIQDPFVALSGIRIIPSALEELSLTSGGYTAEYGEALSGVVSAVTREGGSVYRGGIRLYEGFTHQYDVQRGEWGNLSRVGNRSSVFHLSGPIPGFDPNRYTFTTSGEYMTDATSLPHNGLSSYTGTAKIAIQPTPSLKLKTNITYYDADGDIYDHRDVNNVSYDFNLDGLTSFKKAAYLVGMTGNYSFNERMILSTYVNRFYTYTKEAPDKYMDVYWKDWPGYSEDADGTYNGTIHVDNYGNSPDFSDELEFTGFTIGEDFCPLYRFRETRYDAFSTSIISQVNKTNQLKAGLEYRKYSISWDSKQFFNPNPYGERYKSKPAYASLFLEDKMEYDHVIVNLGVRYDYRDADISYNITPGDTSATYKEAESRSRLSPRLGVSFPISEKSVMHFNYGVYYQVPRFTHLYTNLQGDISSGLPLLGNPDLEPEQTTTYELGLDHLIGEDLRIDATAYYKDIKDLVTTRSSLRVAGQAVTHFTNDDYGSVKGFDLALEKLANGGIFGASVSYSYMIANGNGSYAREPYYTYLTSNVDTLAPSTEYPLDFDQRHTLTGFLSCRVPADWRANFLGVPIPGAWGVAVVGHYGSGLPFTPTDASGNRLGERNEGRLPANYTVDMRLNKDYRLNRNSWLLSLFVEVDNLFNRRNVMNVYSRTGQADDDGNAIGGASLALNQEELDYYDRLYDHDPQNYSPPRTVRVGMELNF